MRIMFVGAAHEVTGSCTLIEAAGKKILVDCGMEQGIDLYENRPLPIAPADVDCILLTHAHIDHSGKIPLMTARGFKGKIYATDATVKLCEIMLLDSAHIQEQEAKWQTRKALRRGEEEVTPLYTVEDAERSLDQFRGCSYNSSYDIYEGISIRFIDAGHLLGSSSIEITLTENGVKRVLLFSGDIGNVNRPLIRDPQKPEKADIVIIESTYGTRVHPPRRDYKSQLADICQRTFDRGGTVVIPSFAVGRTQELLFLLREIKEEGLIKHHDGFPVWVDSPLSVAATNIYDGGMEEYYDEETLAIISEGRDVLKFPDLKLSVTTDESRAINFDEKPKVIISSSGMCEAGRIRHHLKHNLWKPENTVLFVGYQAEGTLGSKLIGGADEIKLFGELIHVNARIEQMDGISGHADRDMLLDWLRNLKTPPMHVFVNHGSDTVTDMFAEQITAALGFVAEAPYSGGTYDLETLACLDEGNKVKFEKAVPKTVRVSTVFERLVNAGKRLMVVIEHNRGGANKDLAKFADQIDALSNKWDR